MLMVEALPDEIIEHILTFVKDRDLGRCRQVNRRLHHIANSPYIVTLFPHISLDGLLYLKEQAYFTPALRDRILATTESNDLEWLVSRSLRRSTRTVVGLILYPGSLYYVLHTIDVS